MSPEDPIDRLSRLHESLLAQSVRTEVTLGTQAEQLRGHDEDIAKQAERFEKAAEQFSKALKAVDDGCEHRTKRIEARIDEKVGLIHGRLDKQDERGRWTIKERVTLYAALIAGPLTALVVYLASRGG